MPIRKQILASNEIYHILNRGVNSMPIFDAKRDYQRFMNLISYYRYENSSLSFSYFDKLESEQKDLFIENMEKTGKVLIDIYSYCLMPNHFHFLVRQLIDGGIQKAFSRIQNAYAKFYNIKNRRGGPLFQSRFSAIRIETDEIFLHVSRYIHLNPCTSFMVKVDDLAKYEWSSYPDYIEPNSSGFVNKSEILKMVGSPEDYKKFVLDQAEYQRKLNIIKHYLLES